VSSAPAYAPPLAIAKSVEIATAADIRGNGCNRRQCREAISRITPRSSLVHPSRAKLAPICDGNVLISRHAADDLRAPIRHVARLKVPARQGTIQNTIECGALNLSFPNCATLQPTQTQYLAPRSRYQGHEGAGGKAI